MNQVQHGRVIFSFFGPPGSGKGTVAQQCREELDIKVLSTGDLCRKHVAMGTRFGKMLDQYLRAGQLIPDELITEMVQDWLLQETTATSTIILDGFPRTAKQAEMFLSFLKKHPEPSSFAVVFFSISDEEIVRRLSNRLVCSNKDCQAVYSLSGKRSVRENQCDICGSPLVRRADDREDVIRERLKLYPNYRENLLAYYKQAAVVIKDFPVADLTAKQVFGRFVSIINSK